MEFTDLTGRRFKIWYKDMYSLTESLKLSDYKPKYIEGVIENFCPTSEVVLNDETYGFNIIPYKSIIYMIEVLEAKK